jgi:hypothetical protein
MTMLQKPTVLILGSTGQIGRFILEYLKRESDAVHVRVTARRPEQVAPPGCQCGDAQYAESGKARGAASRRSATACRNFCPLLSARERGLPQPATSQFLSSTIDSTYSVSSLVGVLFSAVLDGISLENFHQGRDLRKVAEAKVWSILVKSPTLFICVLIISTYLAVANPTHRTSHGRVQFRVACRKRDKGRQSGRLGQ